MASISQQITALKLRKSNQQKARDAAEARRKREAFRSRVSDQRPPGSVMDPGFVRQLEAKRVAVTEAANAPRTDPRLRIEQLRQEGKLPPVSEEPDRPEFPTRYSPLDALKRMLGTAPAREERVGYEPTPEEVLGDEALPKPTAPPVPAVADPDCPPADDVLRGAPGPYLPGDLTADELAEIDRLNPRRPVASAGAPAGAAATTVARPGRPVHTAQQRRRGR